MTTIPEDVMQTAEAAYLASLHDSMAGKAGYLKHIGLAILAERDGWQLIETYHAADQFAKVEHVLCGHDEKKWIRFGRYYPEMKRWYYSGTNERSQWAQVEGDAPTHWRPAPKPPVSSPNATEDHHHD